MFFMFSMCSMFLCIFKKKKQGVQGLQALAFCVVTVNDGHTEPSAEVKYKDGICSELCLKLWFDSDWYLCNITESGWF